MQYLRHTSALADTLVILMIISSFLFSDGYSYSLEDEVDEKSQRSYSEQLSRLVKRKSQISCHCCSNSFNSHCCLQCMQRMGKRSDETKATSTILPVEGFSEDSNEEYSLLQRTIRKDGFNDQSSRSILCSCCLLQMNKEPFSGQWPCCDKCNDKFKREMKSDMSVDNVM